MAGTSAGEGGIYNTVNLNVYHYGGNNPVKYIDPDGRDIIKLLDPARGRANIPILNKIAFGHSAALVGDNENGWLYYSNDGPTSTDVQWFASEDDFYENYAKTRGNPFKFDKNQSQRVATRLEQDKAMQEKAFDLAGINHEVGFEARLTGKRFSINEEEKPTRYRFLTNNCSQDVAKIAFAGEVFSTNSLIPKLQTLMNKETYIEYLKLQSMKNNMIFY